MVKKIMPYPGAREHIWVLRSAAESCEKMCA
jgi:hypothetical protein